MLGKILYEIMKLIRSGYRIKVIDWLIKNTNSRDIHISANICEWINHLYFYFCVFFPPFYWCCYFRLKLNCYLANLYIFYVPFFYFIAKKKFMLRKISNENRTHKKNLNEWMMNEERSLSSKILVSATLTWGWLV